MTDDKKSSEDKTDSPVKTGSKKKSSRKKSPASKPRSAPIMRDRVYRFEQWAARRGVAQHHKGGLRAYVADVQKPRTLVEWDACFKDY